MRLNNELIVFDLEATSNQEDAAEKPAVQTNNFIIEIGAALLDRDLKLVDTFQSLVRPEEPITPFITQITSITPEMCAGQPLWKEVAPEFEAWIMSHCDNIKRVRLCAWGTYFDIPMLRAFFGPNPPPSRNINRQPVGANPASVSDHYPPPFRG